MIIRRRSQGDRLRGPMVNPITPSAPIEISNVFGPRPFSPHIGSTGYDYDFHRGVDFPNAPEGTPCYAASSGAVIRKNYTHFHWKNSNQLNEFDNTVNSFNPWSLSVTDRLSVTADSEGSPDWELSTLSILKAKNAVINTGFDNYVIECKLGSGFSTTYGEVGIGLLNEETQQFIHLSYNGSSLTIRGIGYAGEIVDNATEYPATGVVWLRIEYDFATDTTSWQRSTDGDTWVTLGSEVGFGFSYIPGKPILTWSGYNASAESGTDSFEILEFNWIDENQTIGRFGNWVTINREEGKVLQVHLSTVDVNLGDFVSAGTLVGTIGRTGFNTRSGRINGVHAHLEWSDVTIAAYSQDEALNPLESGLLPRVNVSNNISLTLSEENDPESDPAWKIDVEVLRADSDFDFNSLVIDGNAASRTIDFNLRTGLNPDNDIPLHDGVYIVPADGFTHLSASYQCTFYVKKSAIGSASIHVEAYDCNGILCDSADLSGAAVPTNLIWRSSVSDDHFRTTQPWAPGASFGLAAIVSIEEASGTGTLIDLGGVTSGVVLWAKLRANTSTNVLELVYRTNGGTVTQNVALPSGTWADKQPRFIWALIEPGTPGSWRFGVGDPAVGVGTNNKSGVVAGGIPTTASAQPVRLWTDVNTEVNQTAGYMALAIWDALPSDTALGANPTDSAGFATLMAAANSESRVLRLGLETTNVGEVVTLTDPSTAFTWSLFRGTRPAFTAPVAEPQYSLGAVRIGLTGQSNARGGHTEAAETITLPSYTLVQSTGTTVDTGSNITAYGPDLGILATMRTWVSSIEIGKHAVGGSEITTWIGAGANKTTWYSVLDSMSAYPTDIVWVHGEADSIDLANANNYETRLATWASETRTKVGAGVRLHLADLQELPAGYPHWIIVRDAIRNYVASDPLAFLINTDNLTKIVDNVHYDGGSTRMLGSRSSHSIASAM